MAGSSSRPPGISATEFTEVLSLQAKARAVLGPPLHGDALWWVTRRGLQQVTRSLVANQKAIWFGKGSVADLCCGLGGDTIALARRGPTIGIDSDAKLLSLTRENLRVAGVTATLRTLDVMTASREEILADASHVHVDPDRRADGQRHTSAESLQPPWSRVEEIIKSCQGGVVKLAPATTLDRSAFELGHRVWISLAGRVREQSFVFGDLLDHSRPREYRWRVGGRSAMVLRSSMVDVFAESGKTSVEEEPLDAPEQWMIDPDAAIRAAGLTEAFASRFGLHMIGGPSGFLTSDRAKLPGVVTRMCKTAPVQVTLSCQEKRWRSELRLRSQYPESIKVRGTDHNPDVLTKRLRGCGETPVTLWVGRSAKGGYAVITPTPG